LAELLAMEFHFHPAFEVEEECFGDAVLSRYPMRLMQAGALPSVKGGFFVERRGALWVEIDVGGMKWQILNTHLGLGWRERRVQARVLLGERWVGAVGMGTPLVLCGDFNSCPGGGVHGMLKGVLREVVPFGGRNTFPAGFPMLSLDHVFVGADVDVIEAAVWETCLARVASDHLPVLAVLRWGLDEG